MLGARIKAKNSGDHVVEFTRNEDFAPPAAIGAARMMEHVKVGGKGTQQITELAGQHQAAFGRVAVRYNEIVLLGEVLDRIEVFPACSVAFGQLGLRQIFAITERLI